MVVGAQVYIFFGVLPERGIDIHSQHIATQVTMNIIYCGPLRTSDLLSLLWAVVFDGCGYDHAINVDSAAEGLLVFVGHIGISHTTLGTSAECHESPYLISAAHHEYASISNLSVAVGNAAIIEAIHHAIALHGLLGIIVVSHW